MPTDRTDQLNNGPRRHRSGEVPRSPRGLDERIVQQARLKAEEYARYSKSTGFNWLGSGWRTAVGVFSVSVIALAVTISVVDRSRTTSVFSDRATAVPERGRPANEELVERGLNAPPDDVAVLRSAEVELLSRDRVEVAGIRQQSAALIDAASDPVAEPQPAPSAGFSAFGPDDLSVIRVESDGRTVNVGNMALPLSVIIGNVTQLEARLGTARLDAPEPFLSTNLLQPLSDALDVIEDAFLVVLTRVEPYAQPGSAPTISQLVDKATALTATYRAMSDQPRTQQRLESAFRLQSGSYGADRFPPSLEATIALLENWLSRR